MPPPRWALPDQDEYLQLNVADYLKAKKNQRVDRFWTKLNYGWFERWPESKLLFPDLTAEDLNEEQEAQLQVSLTA